MRIVCICPVRNEDWILGLSARAMLMWCDELVVLNHASTDGTTQILRDLSCEVGSRIQIYGSDDEQWNEMAHRQRLLDVARGDNATHIVMVDADEVLTGNLLPGDWSREDGAGVRGLIERCPKTAIMQLPWLCLQGSVASYHVQGLWAEQDVSMAFPDDPRAYWAARDGYDFHHRHPMGLPFRPYRPLRSRTAGGLMHLQFVSERRLKAKQALYQAIEVLRWPGREPVDTVRARYSQTVCGSETGTLAPVPLEWWAPYRHLLPYFKPDAEPWQEVELKRLVELHGRERFAGLDFFGVA